jgi:hypothetical protein
MSTKTRLVARTVCDVTGKGHVIFNDKMADGRRSLKVWGWGEDEYYRAKAQLEVMGCTVKLVVKERFDARWGGNLVVRRLHVTENVTY